MDDELEDLDNMRLGIQNGRRACNRHLSACRHKSVRLKRPTGLMGRPGYRLREHPHDQEWAPVLVDYPTEL